MPMLVSSLTILGGGNTAFAVAANLTLAGHRVTLCEIPSFGHTVEPLQPHREITCRDGRTHGAAHPAYARPRTPASRSGSLDLMYRPMAKICRSRPHA